MPLKHGYKRNGFADPISLFAIGALLVSLAVGTVVINKKGADFNPNESARVCAQDCEKDSDCSTGYYCSKRSLYGETCSECKIKPTSNPTTTPSGGCTSGSCYYGVSGCSTLGRKAGSGTCSGGICCGAVNTTNNCTKGNSYCVDSDTLATCKLDKSGYKQTDCASGYKCDSVKKKCVVAPTSTPTATPTPASCATKNQSCSDTKPCCSSDNVCTSLYGGKFCVPKGDCTSGDKKCVVESGKSYVYTCNTNGYWDKTKTCDFGCDGSSCKKACTAGAKRCNGSELETCNSDGTAWAGQSCTNGCQTVSGVSSCKGAPTPTPKATVKPTATPTPSSCANRNESCSNKSCCSTSDTCQSLPGGKFCVAKGTQCTSGQEKCVAEGSSSYVYTCSSGGYWQKDKACDFGCDGNSCKQACTPGAKQCNGNELQTCNSAGTAWTGQSCTNGCQTISGASSCKVALCEANSCNSECAQKTKGNIGQCSAGVCKCSAPSLKGNGSSCSGNSECLSGYCYSGNQVLGGSPFDFVKTCHAASIETMNKISRDTNTAVAIAGSTLLTAGAMPAIEGAALAGYSYASAYLTSLPASLQTAFGLIGAANVADDLTSQLQCIITLDPQACAIAQAAILNPIPGAGLSDDLQHYLATNPFSTNMSGVPRMPGSTAFTQQDLENYLSTLSDPAQIAAARLIGEKVMQQYVSNADFLDTLYNKTIPSLNNMIGNDPYFAIVEQGKSNKWVTQLALPYLNQLPTDVLATNSLNGRDVSNAISYLKLNPSVRSVVLFDDASYSGMQLGDYTAQLQRMAGVSGITDLKINVAVPYVTQAAEQRILKYPEISMASHNLMPTADQILSQSELNTLINAGIGNFSTRTLSIFDHKVADSISTLDLQKFLKSNGGFIPDPFIPYR